MIAQGIDLGRELGQSVCLRAVGCAGCLLGCRLHFCLCEFFSRKTLWKLGVHLGKLSEQEGVDWQWKQIHSVGKASWYFLFPNLIQRSADSVYTGHSFWRNIQAASILKVKESWKEICLGNLTAWNKSLKIK